MHVEQIGLKEQNTVKHIHTGNNIQIVTGIEVNSESNFPKLRNIAQVPKARGQYSRNFGKLDSLLINDDSHYLFCYTSDRNGDGIRTYRQSGN